MQSAPKVAEQSVWWLHFLYVMGILRRFTSAASYFRGQPSGNDAGLPWKAYAPEKQCRRVHCDTYRVSRHTQIRGDARGDQSASRRTTFLIRVGLESSSRAVFLLIQFPRREMQFSGDLYISLFIRRETAITTGRQWLREMREQDILISVLIT